MSSDPRPKERSQPSYSFDITDLPDHDVDFITEEDLAAFANVLFAPEPSPSQDDLSIHSSAPAVRSSNLFITALNDWRPVRQRVRRKRRKPRRGKDETREGFVYTLLKWPLLVGIMGWLLALSISYLLTRFYIFIYEHYITWRGTRNRLRRNLRSQISYDGWIEAAKELDAHLGNDKWKSEDEYAYYDSKTVKRALAHMTKLRKQAEADEKTPSSDGQAIDDLRGLVEASVKTNFVGIENPRLYSESYYGTKDLVQNFVEETHTSLAFLKSTKQLDKEAKRSLFKHLHTNFGRTALCLSGGATFAYYHFGVAKALLDADLLPDVITGTSGGALVAVLLGTRTNDELKKLLVPALANKITACHDDITTWLPRWWKTGARFDSLDWARRCSWFTRGSMTFREAYQRTGRILNVSCVPSDPHSPTILANYLTAPDCVIWSTVLASAAVPGILNPVVLMKKTKTGKLEPYSFGHKWKDGSLRTDIPLKALNLHFNVNFSIVSQANPHINLFFFSSRGTVGRPVTHRRGRGWRGGFLGSATEQYLKLDLTKWLKVLRHLELLPRPLGSDWSEIWLQRFSGTITIWPKSIPSDFYYILSDPSVERLARMIHMGQLATWPKLKFIENRLKVERAIEEGRRATRPVVQAGGIAEILSEDDLQALLRSAKAERDVGKSVPRLRAQADRYSLGGDSSPELVSTPVYRRNKPLPRTPQDSTTHSPRPESPSLSMRFGDWWNRSRGSLDQPRRDSSAVYGSGHERRGSLVDELTRQSRVFFDDDDFDRDDGNEDATTSGSELDTADEAALEDYGAEDVTDGNGNAEIAHANGQSGLGVAEGGEVVG
jgi:predicted acylesterase/phospholipase RssA